VPIATQVVQVACDESGRIAGFAELDPVEGLVKACYVDPDFDRQGVGRALMEGIERAAREHGRSALTLDASLNAVPFYEALGWRNECPARHELAPGAWLDCAIMTKPLR
jgi:GNAT superfamily N-acetyltransferase